MRKSRPRLAPLAALVLLAGAALSKDNSLAKWLEGPVRYIASPEEIKEWKGLKTDPDRAAFVERFWRHRDPTPATLVNEYRQLFWKRVRECDEKFLDSPGPAWRTDRGKIYILYGPPDEVHEDPNARTETSESAGAGLIRWTYNRPGNRKDVDPVVYVPFVRDVTGEYHLSYDPKLASPFFNWDNAENKRLAGIGDFLEKLEVANRSPLSVMLDLGKMQEVPPQEEVLLESVETVENFAFAPLPLSIDRFETTEGAWLVVVTVGLPSTDDGEPPTLLGRFARGGSDAAPRILGEGSFRVEGRGADRVAQTRLKLAPGTWDATVLAVDGVSGLNRVYKGKLEPIPAGPFRASDLVLAKAMEPLPYATQASYDDPFIVGGFRLTPLVGGSIARGEPIRVYAELYGGTPPFRLTYQIEGKDNDGSWRQLGRPQEREAAERNQGYSLETGPSWPLGEYRIRLRAVDAGSLAVERVVAFHLAAPPESH